MSKPLTRDLIQFTKEMAVYWEKEAVATKEDATFWAAMNNKRLCEEVALALEEKK